MWFRFVWTQTSTLPSIHSKDKSTAIKLKKSNKKMKMIRKSSPKISPLNLILQNSSKSPHKTNKEKHKHKHQRKTRKTKKWKSKEQIQQLLKLHSKRTTKWSAWSKRSKSPKQARGDAVEAKISNNQLSYRIFINESKIWDKKSMNDTHHFFLDSIFLA
jgi:hypothetical protein